MLELGRGGIELVLDPSMGGRAVSWRVDGHELLTHDRTGPVEYGMYAMGPWAGRIRGNTVTFADRTWSMPPTLHEWAIHGTIIDKPVTVVDAAASSAVLRAELHDPWPWPGHIDMAWTVLDDAVLADITVHAETEPFPAVVGWHPWFVRDLGIGEPAQWSLGDARIAERNAAFELSGTTRDFSADEGPFDDAFLVPGRHGSIEWPQALRIDVDSSHDWYVVYDGWPPTICLEPQSGPPDGVNASALAPVTVVTPQVPLVLQTRWAISRGPLLG